MHAIILAGGDTPERVDLDTAWPGWDDGAELVVAADGGARSAARLGLRLDRIVGDGDSLGTAELARLEASGITVERSPRAKDETDTELAILAALRLGADRLTVLGALGGRRLDHALANVALLAMPSLAERPAALLDAAARVTLLRAPGPDGGPAWRQLPGPPGSLVSLIPFGDGVEGVTTGGLEYPLRDEPLPAGPARGLSNVRTAADASVSLRRGLLLIVESPASLER